MVGTDESPERSIILKANVSFFPSSSCVKFVKHTKPNPQEIRSHCLINAVQR